jgi:hypothetical protein
MLLIQVDNLIIPPPVSAEDYIHQLEEEGLGEEDAAALKTVRAEREGEEGEAGDPHPAIQHIFKKHFRQGRFLMATEAEGAAARVIRDLGFAGFINAPAAFISCIALRQADPMLLMQASALTEWFAEVETPVGKVFGLHYPSSWINMPAPVREAGEHPVQAILKRIMLNSAPLLATERHFPDLEQEIRWVTPKTQWQVTLDSGETVTSGEAVIELANTISDRHLRIRRIAGGDLVTAEICRPLFPEFF